MQPTNIHVTNNQKDLILERNSSKKTRWKQYFQAIKMVVANLQVIFFLRAASSVFCFTLNRDCVCELAAISEDSVLKYAFLVA